MWQIQAAGYARHYILEDSRHLCVQWSVTVGSPLRGSATQDPLSSSTPLLSPRLVSGSSASALWLRWLRIFARKEERASSRELGEKGAER